MISLGMGVTFAGYGLVSWGYILVKGYNITLREWFSPLNPYTGPLDGNGCVPKGHIFPVAGKGGPCTSPATEGTGSSSPAVKRADKAAQQAHRPSPGSVQGRL